MTDNHGNFSSDFNNVNPGETGTQPTQETNNRYAGYGASAGNTGAAPQTPTQAQTGYTPYGAAQQRTPAYTWNGSGYAQQTYPYVYRPQPEKKPKKARKGAPLGVRILLVILCCAVTSAATLGAFVYMLQHNIVQISPDGGSTPAFTIARIVDDTEDEPEESGTVSALSEQDIAEQLIPSIVCIQNYQITEPYGFFASRYGTADDVSPAGEGSGIIFREDGYIVTNAHVVEGATELKVMLSDNTTYEAELIGSDTVTDLAVVKIDATGLTAAQFGSSSDLRVADRVMAIGNPGGHTLSSSVTIGYISALNRSMVNEETGYTMDYIQTDAAINPGNSGGALVNMYGQVIGINSAKISATEYEGLGFAIPSDLVQGIVSDLMEYGYVRDRAMLGISGQFIDAMTGRFYGLPQGEYVGELNTDRAAASGLQPGDVITAIDGTELTSESALRTLVNAKKPGETSELTVYRPESGQSITLTLTYSEYTGG